MFTADSKLRSEHGELFHLFTDCVLDYAMFTLDASGSVAGWNHGAERMFGYTSEEIKGRPVARFYPQDALSQREASSQLAMAQELESFEIEGSRVRKDGSQMWSYVVITALRDPQQRLSGYAVVTRDITAQRRALEEIQEQKRRMRSILDTAVDAVVTIDELGIVESINPAGEQMFGYRADEVIGENVNMLMPQPFSAEHTGYIQRYLRTGHAKIIGLGREVQARRKDGSIFPADLAVSTFYDGRPLFTGILRDISDRKAMEAEVLHIAESEQRRIGQELHDDAQQQLSALTMIARHAADSIAALASQDPLLAEAQSKVERVVKGLRDANQSLRELARGLVPLQVDSHGLPDALIHLAAQISELHALDCRCSIDDGIDITDSSAATHLFRIAQEAVNNSLKHGSARQIEIRLRSRDKGFCLEVEDDGVGLLETGENRGRGLHIMAYRAGLIGGVLTVRNVEGGGTIVVCALQRPLRL